MEKCEKGEEKLRLRESKVQSFRNRGKERRRGQAYELSLCDSKNGEREGIVLKEKKNRTGRDTSGERNGKFGKREERISKSIAAVAEIAKKTKV